MNGPKFRNFLFLFFCAKNTCWARTNQTGRRNRPTLEEHRCKRVYMRVWYRHSARSSQRIEGGKARAALSRFCLSTHAGEHRGWLGGDARMLEAGTQKRRCAKLAGVTKKKFRACLCGQAGKNKQASINKLQAARGRGERSRQAYVL